jgi:hypothetical protein
MSLIGMRMYSLVYWGTKVKVLDIQTHILRAFSGNSAILETVLSGEVC